LTQQQLWQLQACQPVQGQSTLALRVLMVVHMKPHKPRQEVGSVQRQPG
jgi:hypothetical protein